MICNPTIITSSSTDPSDIITVTFYDWDNTYLGSLPVKRGSDARAEVNAYVRDNFIHPELRGNTGAKLGSLERTDTYRGPYPHTGPDPDNPLAQGGPNTVTDGEQFPLTNKLDYVFYKAYTTQDAEGAEVKHPYDEEYPYTHGWVQVTPQTLEDTWTTLGVGELEIGNAPTTVDFLQDILNFPTDVSVIYVKALYRPGTPLNNGGGTNYIETKETYGMCGVPTYTDGNYAIKFQYQRINKDGFGTTRRRAPAVKVSVKMGTADASPFLLEAPVKNFDRINVALQAPRRFWSIDYVLVERYGQNFVTGGTASSQSGNGTFFNYETGVGSDGFVKRASWPYFMKQVEAYIAGQANEFDGAHITGGLLNDCGFMNYQKEYFSGSDVADAVDYDLPTLYQNAKNAGLKTLTFYQLQYGIHDYGTLKTDAEAKEWYWSEFYPGSAHEKAGVLAVKP